MIEAGRIIDAVQGLTVAQGPMAGEALRLGTFQRNFIEGAFPSGVKLSRALSVGPRQAAKPAAFLMRLWPTTHSAGLSWECIKGRNGEIVGGRRARG